MPMASPTLAPWRCAVFALVALVALAGLTRTGNGAAPTVGGSASRNAYPDWAAAIAPAYTSNVKGKGRTTDQFYDVYQIDTADPYETVLAWYKAHVKTTWPNRNPTQTAARVGQVVITLQKAEASDGVRTSIGFLKKR